MHYVFFLMKTVKLEPVDHISKYRYYKFQCVEWRGGRSTLGLEKGLTFEKTGQTETLGQILM